MIKKLSEVYGANKVLELSTKISPMLINEAIENNSSDLLLGAIMSLETAEL